MILTLLRNQNEEAQRIIFSLYGTSLTTQQVKELFDDFYGQEYSTSQVSRMFNTVHNKVKHERPLEKYYPIVIINATFISTRRGSSISKEAYYTIQNTIIKILL